MRIQAPVLGLHEGVPAQDQPVLTSFSMQNVRPFDTAKERRLGQRPGTSLAYTTQIAGDFAVIRMVSIVTTYIQPE